MEKSVQSKKQPTEKSDLNETLAQHNFKSSNDSAKPCNSNMNLNDANSLPNLIESIIKNQQKVNNIQQNSAGQANQNSNPSQNLSNLLFNLFKTSPLWPVQQQASQQAQTQTSNLPFLPFVHNSAQFQLSNLFQNPLLNNYLNGRLSNSSDPNLTIQPVSSTPNSTPSSTPSSTPIPNNQIQLAEQNPQTQPINLSKHQIKQEKAIQITNDEAPLDLSSKKSEKKIKQKLLTLFTRH